MSTFETPSGAEIPGDRSGEGLTDTERAMLAFEREWWKLPGAKEAAIKERFSMTATQYYQHVNKVIDTPAAAVFDPLLVKRLQRRRATRRRQV